MGGLLDGFDTPSLLGAWNSAPYLHDGSALTLRDAVLAHKNLNIAGDIDLLVEYLRQIDDSETNNDVVTSLSDRTINDKAIMVYPNPAQDKLYVSGTEPGDQLTVYNTFGVTVRQYVVITKGQAIDVSGLPPGVYTLSVKDKKSLNWIKQ